MNLYIQECPLCHELHNEPVWTDYWCKTCEHIACEGCPKCEMYQS